MRAYVTGIFILFCIAISITETQAQRKNPLRVELNANLEMENYNLVPCGRNGILVFYESNEKGSAEDTKVWHFALYDENLQQQWLADTALINGVKFKGFDHGDASTYLFFLDVNRRKSEHKLQLVKVEYDTNIFRVVNSQVPEKAEPFRFKVFGRHAFIAFNNSDHSPGILKLGLADGSASLFGLETEGEGIIREIRISPEMNKIALVLDQYIKKRHDAMLLMELSPDGDLLRKQRISTAADNKVINDARIAKLSGDTILITGTYGNSNYRLDDSGDKDRENAGMFVTRFDGEKQSYMHYFNFLEFEEMFDAFSSRTLADLRRAAKQDSEDGKEYSLDYTMLLHNVIPFDGNYVLLAEAYYPEYHTESNMLYDYYGRPIPQTYTVFDGYRYISGIAASFSEEGEMIWNDGIDIRDIQTFNLYQSLGTYASPDELALFYSSANRLYYKMAGSKAPEGELQNIVIESKYKGDRLTEDLGSKVIHWYRNYFICYGYQVIKNNRARGGRRTIFYFNKLAFN